MEIHINEIIEKAESHYKKNTVDGNYNEALEVIKSKILEFIIKVEEDPEQKDVPVWEAVHYMINISDGKEDKYFRIFVIIAGFKLEEEKQKNEQNDEDWKMLVKIIMEELKEFYLPPGVDAKVMSIDEFIEETERIKKTRRASLLKRFFLHPLVYFPLSLPFIIIQIIIIIGFAVKLSEENKPIDSIGRANNRKSKLPAIFDMKYYNHHIICGIILWTIILKWIFY